LNAKTQRRKEHIFLRAQLGQEYLYESAEKKRSLFFV